MDDKRKQQLIRVYETLSTDKLKEVIKEGHACLGGGPLIKAELLRRNIAENELPSDSEIKLKPFLTNLKGISVLALLLTLFGPLIFVCIYDF